MSLPTPPEIIALRRFLYSLVGGEQGCPRRRFFLCMAVAVMLAVAAAPVCISEVMPPQIGTGALEIGRLNPSHLIFTLLVALCILLAHVSGGLFMQLADWFSIAMGAELSFSSASLNIYLCGSVAMVAGLVIFVLGCRRLRDAGFSRWNLLASLTYIIWPLLLGNGLICIALQNLGGLWLLWLYCKPTRQLNGLPPAPETPAS